MQPTAEALRQVVAFAALDEASLSALLACMRTRRWPADAIVVRAGEPGSTMLVVVDGTLAAVLDEAAGASVLNQMGPGEVIGEMAFLDPAPRSATVKALTDVVACELDHDAMEVLRRRAPAAVAALVTMAIRDVTRRLRNLDERIARELDGLPRPPEKRTP
jgi:CRP-like cAMP-binding protein